MEVFVLLLLGLMGIVFLVTEVVLIPGFGLTGILGVISFMAAVCYSFVVMGTLAGWLTLISVVLLCVVLILWSIYGKSIDKMALKEKIASSVADPNIATLSVGMKGVAVTRLASIGNIDINGNTIEATAQFGEFVDAGEIVEITRLENGTVYVKKVK